MTGRQLPAALVGLGAFLAPLIGGGFPTEVQPLGPGLGATVAAIAEGTPAPAMAHALIGLPIAAAFLLCLRARAVQTPTLRVLLPLLGLFGLLALTVLASDFRYQSAHTWFMWAAYALAFAASVAACGRGSGPQYVLGGLVAGACLVALKGKVEYDQMRAIDPSWRIFAGWTNPNALAGMLLLGLFPALGLMLVARRPWNLAAGAAAAAITVGLLLTGSKGGLLAGAAGVAVLAVLTLAWGGWKKALLALVPVALGAAFVLAAPRAEPGAGGGPSSLARVADASATQEQSAGFRMLLWKSAIEVALRHPVGVGIGSYRHWSAEPGLTEQTVLAHNSFLQLAAEGSWVSLLLFVALMVLWGREMYRGARALGVERNLLRAAVVAAAAASLAHGMADSDLWFHGIGVAFFLLLGVGLQLAADASGPELTPGSFRRSLAGATVLLVGIQAYFAGIDRWKSRVVHDMGGDPASARAGAEGLTTWAPSDGEAWALRARTLPPSEAGPRLEALSAAARLSPSSRNLRALAEEEERLMRPGSAEDGLRSALRRDPTNLRTLAALRMLLHRQGRLPEAREIAARLVALEGEPVFRIRALPEIVPTETFDARVYLAETADDPASLLLPAVAGYARYAATTVPFAVRAAKAGAAIGGATPAEARSVLQRGEAAAAKLATLDAGVEADRVGSEARSAFAKASALLDEGPSSPK